MIVYGVAEASGPGRSEADRIEPVGPVDEDTLRAIRRVAGNSIYPPVAGLQLIPLVPTDAADSGKEADGGVLVLLVPDSHERPHLIHPSNGQGWFAVPYRHGPDTQWMVERQVASAYIEREINRRQRSVDFDTRFDAFTSVLDAGGPMLRWVVAVAVPDAPLPRPHALTLGKAHGIIGRAWASPLAGGSFGPCDLTQNEQTRQGLRRFFRSGRRDILAASSAVAQARVEVHGDGTVAVAFTRDGAIPREGRQLSQVPVDDLEQTALDCFALLHRVQVELGVSGDYSARMTVYPPTQIFRHPDPVIRDAYRSWDEQERVYGYVPVDGPVLTSEGLEAALTSWTTLVSDAVNQTGAQLTFDVGTLLTHIEVES